MEKYAIPGVYSTVGKTTHKSLHRLRTIVASTELRKPEPPKAQEFPGEGDVPAEEQVHLLRYAQVLGARRFGRSASGGLWRQVSSLGNSGGASASCGDLRHRPSSKLNTSIDVGPPSPTSPVSMASPTGRPLNPGQSPTPSPTAAASTYAQTPAAHDEPLALTLHPKHKEMPEPPTKQSQMFLSQGQEKETFCEAARSKLKRFVHAAKLHKNPEVGRYTATHTLIHERTPSCDFGEREKHPSRRIPEDLPDNCLGPESLLDNCFSRSASSSRHLSHSMSAPLEQMALQTARPDLAKISGIKPNEVSCPAADKDDQDKKTSHFQRKPDVDLGAYLPRKDMVWKDTWEPGKYGIQWSSVESKPRCGKNFEQHLTRAERAKKQDRLATELLREEGRSFKEPLKLDRGLYRGGPQVRKRVTHVRKMSQDLDRPPLAKQRAAYYDEDDPEVCSVTLKREMECDSSTVDNAVVARRDYTILMDKSLDRDRALRGTRVFQGDISLRASQGLLRKDAVHEVESSVEQCKESPNRLRPGKSVPFHLVVGRRRPQQSPSSSPLRQPRAKCAPDFVRVPPCRGYYASTEVPAMSVPWFERSHESLPSWDASEWDEGDSLQQMLPGQSAQGLDLGPAPGAEGLDLGGAFGEAGGALEGPGPSVEELEEELREVLATA